MHVFIATLGSRGDVQPYIALGKGLQAAGHTVTLCTSERFAPFVTEHGLQYGYLSDDFLKLIDTDAAKSVLDRRGGPVETVRSVVALWQQAVPLQRRMTEETWQAAERADPDLILFHPKVFGATHIAEKLGIPAVLSLLMPMYVRTGEAPHFAFPAWGLGGWYNRLTYDAVLKLTELGFSKPIAAWRAAHGLPPWPRGTDMLHTAAGAPVPILFGYSRHVVPTPADWPAHVDVTGYWFLDEPIAAAPSAELAAFLDAGPPPVYVGFGSMTGRDPERRTRLVVEAIQQAGVRGVLASGWGGLETRDLPETILAVDQAPHGWLFPRVAAVVHHGGAGTTAAGLQAGRPTVICPFFGDQPFWGRRIEALGVGPAPLPQKSLTAEKLAAALRLVTADTGVRRRAEALGEKIRQEDGVARAVDRLEAIHADFVGGKRA